MLILHCYECSDDMRKVLMLEIDGIISMLFLRLRSSGLGTRDLFLESGIVSTILLGLPGFEDLELILANKEMR